MALAKLRATFPVTVAACLMPEHLHWIGEGEPFGMQRRFGALLSGFTRHVGERRIWDTVPVPREIPDRQHLARQVRYTHLNPCRAELVDDPPKAPWSTHRGVIGAEVDPW